MDPDNLRTQRTMEQLAYRIAYFYEDYDPYGFDDSLDTSETREDGIQRIAEYAYGEMRTGHFNQLIHDIYDDDMEGLPALKLEMDSIIASLRTLQEGYQNTIRKNPLQFQRRRLPCN